MFDKSTNQNNENLPKQFMNLELTGIHMDVTDELREYFNKKLQRLDFAAHYIIDLLFKLIKEKHGFKLEANVNFKWGGTAYVRVNCFEIFEGIDKLFDKIELKVKKEKSKVQKHY
ncbi:MAG: ribosome-associated translation inhibitor RaiA [Spirochaetales bacterium]|nr:ribosome-associated translation inhibitor RaiA [Spirochaetales bacterium]